MALRTIITTEERTALDPILQAEYKALDGQTDKFVIDSIAVDGWVVEDVAGLRRTVETTRADRDKFRDAAAKFEGVDAAEYKRLLKKKEEIDNWDPTNDDAFKTRIDEANATWQNKYDTDITAANEKAEKSAGRYKTFRKRSEAIAAISKHAPKGVKVLLPHVLGELDVYAQEDGEGDEVWVRGTDGRPRITNVAGQQGNMSPEELVLSMKDDDEFAANFPGTGATGGGATGGGTGKGTVKVDMSLSPVERLKQARRAQAAT